LRRHSTAWPLIEQVEKLGGMTKAVESGWAKVKIEECAARKQARIDSGKDVIVGVNKYHLKHEEPMQTREIDNSAVRESQIARLKAIRAKRDGAAVQKVLDALTECARTKQGNLLDLTIDAVRARATVGEVSDALEKVWGRFRASNQTISGVYGAGFGQDEHWLRLKHDVQAFAAEEGRRPRILIAKLGQDGHDRGARVVGTAFADLGFDIDIGPLFQTPAEAARQAVENDCHAIGVSTLAAGHKTLVPALIQALQELDAGDIIVFVGGVIPPQDYDFLRAAGVAGIFGPGTPIPTCAHDVLSAIQQRTKAEV
jgi:methylmalonyl-CoA mutase